MKVETKNLEKALELFENIIDMHHINGNEDSPYTVNEMFQYDYKTAEAGVALIKGILMGLDIPSDVKEDSNWEEHEDEESWDDDNNMYTNKQNNNMMSKRNTYDTPSGTYSSWKSGTFSAFQDDEGYRYIKVLTKDGEECPITFYGDGEWCDKLGVQKEIWATKKFSRKSS